MVRIRTGTFDIAVHQSFIDAELPWRRIEEHGAGFVFQSFDWCATWFDTIGRSRRVTPVLVHVRDATTGAEMFLPLGVEGKRFGVRVLGFLAGRLADHTAPMVAGPADVAFDDAAMRAILREVGRAAGADVVDFWHLKTRIGALPNPLFHSQATPARYATHRLVLDGTWEAFCNQRLSRSHQAGSRRRWRRLREHGTPRIEIADSRERALGILQVTLVQKAERYRDTGRENPLADDAYREFYTRLTARHHQKGVVNVSALFLDEHVLATHWGCVHRGCFLWLMPSFDPAWGKVSPGRLLLDHLIEWSFREGLRAFDFTIGDEPYKATFANVSEGLYRRIVPYSALGWAYLIKSRLA